MKNKMVFTILIASVIFLGFSAYMVYAKGNTSFYLEDIQGDSAYLNEFSLEGVAGSENHSMIFKIENGKITTKEYPINQFSLDSIFYAQRIGYTGLHKYVVSWHNIHEPNWSKNQYLGNIGYTPSKTGEIRTHKKFEGTVFDNKQYKSTDFIDVRTEVAENIDVYMEMSNGGKHIRIKTDIIQVGGGYEFSVATKKQKESISIVDKISRNTIDYDANIVFLVKTEKIWYVLSSTNENSRGVASIYMVHEDDFISRDIKDIKKDLGYGYSEREIGEAQVLVSFFVDETHRILHMRQVGENHLGIFRTEGKKGIFELYDFQGNLIQSAVVTDTYGEQIDEIKMQIVDWKDIDSTSIHFEAFRKNAENNRDTSLGSGIMEFDGENLIFYKNDLNHEGLSTVEVVRAGQILYIVDKRVREKLYPLNKVQHFEIYIVEGETGKILYQGGIKNNYKEDGLASGSQFTISNQDGIGRIEGEAVYMQERSIISLLPTNGIGDFYW